MASEKTQPERRSKTRNRPSVLAVVVAHEPGSWFDEAMASLAAQSYDRFGVLVVIAGDESSYSAVDATVRRHVPNAKVVHAPDVRGYGDAVAVGLEEFGEQARMLLLCQDDIALGPKVVEILVTEALQSNAGVVGPKLVDWSEPRVIQSVGFAIDKFGVPIPLAERGDLDQEQYDAVDDVFSVAGACLLIRTDLYELVGGYDREISFYGDDVDLCWRVQAAGARIVVAPDAVVRHRDALLSRREDSLSSKDADRLRSRHALRSMLSGYGGFRSARVIPQAILLTLVQVVSALLTGRVGRAKTRLGAWLWNVRRPHQIIRRRRELAAFRELSDGDFRELQRGGSYWLGQAIAARTGGERSESAAAAFSASFKSTSVRAAAAIAGVLSLTLIFGSRHLITRDIPAVGQLASFSSSPGDLIGEWWSGFWSTGLGTDSAAPFGHVLLAIVGYGLFGAMGLLRKLLVLSAIPVGVIGAWSLLRSTGSRRAQIVSAIVYLSIPVGFNSLASGSWFGLLSYAGTPWVLAQLGRAHATAPFFDRDATLARRIRAQVLRLGLLLGLIGAFVPSIWLVVAVMATGLVLGSLVAGSLAGTWRMVTVAVLGSGLALALHLPWFLGVGLPGLQWAPVAAAGSSDVGDLALRDILLFNTGRTGLTTLLAGLAVSASFVLIIGRSWRFVWGARAWLMSVCAWGLLWAGHWGALPVPLPRAEIILPVAAIGLAMACGLGAIAFEVDLKQHNFGWRQLATLFATAGVVIAAVPMLAASTNGRWNMPRSGLDSRMSFLSEDPEIGAFRVLWIGDPDVLPGTGMPLDDSMAFFTTDGGRIDITDQWIGRVDPATRRIRLAIRKAVTGDTSRLGADLAPFGIRYVVFVERIAPAPFVDRTLEVPEVLTTSFAGQLDIRRVATVNRAVEVYRNDAWFPTRSAGLVIDPDEPRPGTPVLVNQTGFTTFEGRIDADSVVFVGSAPASGWRLEVAGVEAERSTAFGWASSFRPPSGGDAVLRFVSTPVTLLARALQLAGWLLVVAAILLLRSSVDSQRRRTMRRSQIDQPESSVESS